VCCYLANLGDVLVRGEWLLVVLGDVLTATDAGRLARVMRVLEEVAQRLPVLILTCHPERYRGLVGANFVDLEAIVRGAGCWNLMVSALAESGPNGAPTQTFST
jgi:hypothetical protein